MSPIDAMRLIDARVSLVSGSRDRSMQAALESRMPVGGVIPISDSKTG